MAVINKLMWLACVLISVAFLALAFVVVGKHEKWLAIAVTIIGTVIMVTTLGLMCYWVIRHRIEASNLRSIRRNSMGSRSRSWSMSAASDTELTDYKKMYADFSIYTRLHSFSCLITLVFAVSSSLFPLVSGCLCFPLLN